MRGLFFACSLMAYTFRSEKFGLVFGGATTLAGDFNMKKMISVIFLVCAFSSLALALPINHFVVEAGRDDGAVLLNGCSKAKKDAIAAALASCYEDGYQRCDVAQIIKVGYWKNGLFDRGFCKYKVIAKGMDDLKRDKFLFKSFTYSQLRRCERVYDEAKAFGESNVLAECRRQYDRCEIISTHVIKDDVYGCQLKSIAKGR